MTHPQCSAATGDADAYEKRIREKVWASECLSAGEWVYLVGLFHTAREAEERLRDEPQAVTYCTPDGPANCEAWAVDKRCPTCPVTRPQRVPQ